jgi:hypothetical protein
MDTWPFDQNFISTFEYNTKLPTWQCSRLLRSVALDRCLMSLSQGCFALKLEQIRSSLKAVVRTCRFCYNTDDGAASSGRLKRTYFHSD